MSEKKEAGAGSQVSSYQEEVQRFRFLGQHGNETLASFDKLLADALRVEGERVRRETLEEARKFVHKWNFMACSDRDGLEEGIRALAVREGAEK